MEEEYGWRAEDAALDHLVDGFVAKTGVGPLAWHQHKDLASIELEKRPRDTLAALRGEDGVSIKLPKVADRSAIKKTLEAAAAARARRGRWRPL